ncbi:MAG: class I SAM-dependent methyltransferase [Roseibium sp.]|nr:class I SAM-dependent methyltransferase [Roseibium sp.]
MSLVVEADLAAKQRKSRVVQNLIVNQFKNPHGLIGGVAGWIMANRRSNIARNRWTVGLLNLSDDANVLEIGCGPGIGLEAVLEAGPATRATGLDHSRLMIQRAGNRLKKPLLTDRLTLWPGSLETLPHGGGFDAVFSCNVLQFVDDRTAFLELVKEHLKPDGLFATTFQPRGFCATAQAGRDWIGAFAEDLCQANFVDVDIREEVFGDMPAFCALGTAPA